jgi:uncharacterized membrane protein
VPSRRHFDPRRALVRVALALAAGLLAYVAVSSQLPPVAAALLGWDVAGLVLLGLIWALVVPVDAATTRKLAGDEDPGRTLLYGIALIASSVSLLAATLLVRQGRRLGGGFAQAFPALCLVTVALAWAITHTAFALRYARLYYREDAEGVGGIELPEHQPPTYFDFAYIAFTIGMCFQVSDVCVTSRQIRRTVLFHAVVSFAYNSVILAFVLNLVFGLAV